MQKKLKVKKGDTVFINTGEYKGQKGRVLEVDKDKDRLIVEGINLISKHTKPNAKNPNGGIIKKEAFIHISNVMLLDPSSGDPIRVGRRLNDKGKLVRYSKKSGEEIK
jgi:large subunit ribosomal protein L24